MYCTFANKSLLISNSKSETLEYLHVLHLTQHTDFTSNIIRRHIFRLSKIAYETYITGTIFTFVAVLDLSPPAECHETFRWYFKINIVRRRHWVTDSDIQSLFVNIQEVSRYKTVISNKEQCLYTTFNVCLVV